MIYAKHFKMRYSLCLRCQKYFTLRAMSKQTKVDSFQIVLKYAAIPIYTRGRTIFKYMDCFNNKNVFYHTYIKSAFHLNDNYITPATKLKTFQIYLPRVLTLKEWSKNTIHVCPQTNSLLSH